MRHDAALRSCPLLTDYFVDVAVLFPVTVFTSTRQAKFGCSVTIDEQMANAFLCRHYWNNWAHVP
jgi:hypothetical protein